VGKKICGEIYGKSYKKPDKQSPRNQPEILEAANQNVKIDKIRFICFANLPDIPISFAALQIHNCNTLR